MNKTTYEQKSFKEIEDISEKILKKFKVVKCPAESLVNIMESEHIKFSEDRDLPENVNGIFYISGEDKGITIRKDIYPPEKKNFIIAHELGHHFLEHLELDERKECNVVEKVIFDEVFQEETRIQEQEANIFASLFLLPEKLIVPYIKMGLRLTKRDSYGAFFLDNKPSNNKDWKTFSSLITNKFKTSREANKWRLYNMGYVRFPES